MCEWLSFGEWSDVKLLCGGRAFNAHRAVLASVSTFLRRILLACPDESPTFIVLPEFDLEAMSSVLYYIYNGEVTVQKQKLNMFLDIINAMQIFIDNQYLRQFSDKDCNNSGLERNNDTVLPKNNVFTLGLQELQDQTYINLKKANVIHDVVSKKYLTNSENKNSLIRDPNEERKTSLGNLKSVCGDRQRNSFLRDLFIETYPRNGNVNGLTTGVLAISNECYHAPASVLLTNANGSHLSVDDILLKPYEKTSEHINYSPTVFHLHEQKRCNRNEQDYIEPSKSFYDLSFKKVNTAETMNNNCELKNALQNSPKNDWMSRIPIPPEGIFQIGLQEQILSGLYVPPIQNNLLPKLFETVTKLDYRSNTLASSGLVTSNAINKERDKDLHKESSSKTTILNYVLDNPWSPRIPQSFKPFRRKVVNRPLPEVTITKRTVNTLGNDSNNNVDKSLLSPDLVNAEDIIVPIDTATHTASVSQISSEALTFKCTICNQVFITRELLLVHMRRHSTNARYTCSECSKTFSQLRNFKYHMSVHRGTREFAATCTVCGKYFNDRGYLSSHMKIHRNRKEYKCTLCPKSFNQRVAYNMHVRIHTGVKPHVCEQCGKAFSRKMLLKQHQRTHSGERPYACPHCDKRFADRSNMTLHLRLHTGIKPFSCTLCPKSFTKKHHLKSHLNFHTGSKPYSCPRCKLAFTQSSNMRTHLKKCRAPEPLQGAETSQTT